jgi:hypothetical protein
MLDLKQGGGLPLLPLYRSDSWWAVCRTCRKRHSFRPASDVHRAQAYEDFAARHLGHILVLMSPADVERLARRAEARRRARHDSVLNYAGNADVKLAFQAADQSLTITALNSLISSTTVGWGSDAIDNSANLYLDYLTAITFAAVNTAPGSDKAVYIFTATALNTTDRPNTGASGVLGTAQASLVFPNITTGPCNLPLLQVVPYITQNVATQTSLFSTARAFGGLIGLQLWYAVVNFSGAAIAASGNAWKYRGVYATVQ